MSEKKIIEIDSDGVLTDIVNTAVSMYNFENIPYPYYPSTYDMQDAGEDRGKLFEALADPRVFYNCKLTSEAFTFLNRLYELLNNSDYKVEVRTMCPNLECAKARNEIFENVFKILDPDANVLTYAIEVGEKVVRDNVVLYIEDCAENLTQSTAEHKILINHSYNQENDYQFLKDVDYVRVNDLDDCYNYIIDMLGDKFKNSTEVKE